MVYTTLVKVQIFGIYIKIVVILKWRRPSFQVFEKRGHVKGKLSCVSNDSLEIPFWNANKGIHSLNLAQFVT
jgi:hypothetical protein